MNNFNKILAIPHYHFDLEWWKTREEYEEVMSRVFDAAFNLLEKHPQFTYVIDQGSAIEPYLMKNPEKRKLLKKYLKEKKVEFVGGTWAAPDENIPYGESLIRQFIIGKQYFKENFNTDINIAWEIDEFGHPAQFAQIMKKCGFDYFVFARGMKPYNAKHPLDFFWESPDGTKIKTHWLSCHYSGLPPLFSEKQNLKMFFKEINSRLQYEGERSDFSLLFVPFGSDFIVPKKDWLIFVKKWNKKENPKINFDLPSNYFQQLEIEKNNDLTVYNGDFNPMFSGCYTSREKVKKLCRQSQNLALKTETFCAIAETTTNFIYPSEKIKNSWVNILENDFHDILCGTGTDRVYENTLKRYYDAISILESEKQNALNSIIKNINIKKDNETAYVIFNNLGWNRKELISLSVFDEKKENLTVTDEKGNSLPIQLNKDELLVLDEFPAMGYKTLYLQQKKSAKAKLEDYLNFNEDNLTIENNFYTLKINAENGNIESLKLKNIETELLNTKKFLGNEIIVEEDVGNLWTIHTTGKFIKEKFPAKIKVKEKGSLRVIIEVEKLHHEMWIKKEITFYAHTARIDFFTSINFWGKDKKIKVVFPFNGFNKKYFVETPFYVEEKKAGVWCAQNFVDVTNEEAGFALINKGIPGYELKNNYLALNLFRSVSVGSKSLFKFIKKNFKDIKNTLSESYDLQLKKGLNLFEMPMYKYHGLTLREWSSKGRPPFKNPLFHLFEHLVPLILYFQEAKCWERGWHYFNYALYPHKGNFIDAELPFKGWEFNNELEVVGTEHCSVRTKNTEVKSKNSENMLLPEKISFLETDNNALLLSLKKCENNKSKTFRIYEPYGKEKKLNIKINFPKQKNIKAEKISLSENKTYEKLKKEKDKIQVNLKSWEIGAIKIS